MIGVRPALAALALAGCGDPEAPRKCEDLIVAICANVEQQCFAYVSAEECEEEFDAELDCGEAIATGSAYPDCMDEVTSTEECLPEVGLPESCEGAVLYIE